ncbi:MAG: M23 family metallopeptidase [Cyanobacteria bacterium P01_D01_bin.156]
MAKTVVRRNHNGQLWKKIGLVGSVAVMGGQPVLAQIEAGAIGDVTTPPPMSAADTFPAVRKPGDRPIVVEEITPVAPPLVIAPEANAPEFSTKPVNLPKIDAITSQGEIVSPEEGVNSAGVPDNSGDAVDLSEVEPDAAETDTAAIETAATADDELLEDISLEEDSTPEPIVLETSPSVDIVKPSDVVPGAIPTVEDLAVEYGGVFVDPTDYEVGATPTTPEVVISERSTGCEYKVNSKNLSAGCGASQPVASAGGINIGPVNISRAGVRFTGSVATVASREYYNTVAKPLVDLQAGESFVFPLASPSPITSLFGWRWHPIHHDYRFHNGTDLGAPQGTPILATQSGQVSVADYLGGYGLTVILRHNDNTLESRYAHMSHILVQPGEWVEQGDVIGLVGSTGNSTGPHLHFELHQLTGQGWVTVNPDDVLRYALANLNNRANGNPLVALNVMPQAEAALAKTALPKDLKTETLIKDMPNFRPAQPHAQ